MNCDQARQELLHYDWDEADRVRLAEVFDHVARCDLCRSTLREYDHLRSTLRSQESEVEPAGGWSALEKRLSRRRVFVRHHAWRWRPLSLAASIVLAMVGWGLYWQNGGGSAGPEPVNKHRLAFVGLTPQEIAEHVHVFNQVSGVFRGQAGWVLVGDQNSDLGLVPKQTAAVKTVLLLRLGVSAEDSPVSTADLVIVPGQTARLTLRATDGSRIHYQISTSQSDQQRLQLWVEVEQPNQDQERLASLATDLRVEPGQVATAGEIMTTAGRYEVSISVSQANLDA